MNDILQFPGTGGGKSSGYSFDEINDALKDDCENFALHLLGKPSRKGAKTWRWDGAYKIELTRRGLYRGVFRDWRQGRTRSAVGVASLVLGITYRDAIQWAALEYLRWPDISDGRETDSARMKREQATADAATERARKVAEDEAEDAAEQAAKIEKVVALRSRAVPIKGTPAEFYLRDRGILADAWPDTLRWHPAKRWLLAISTSPEGDVTALQAIHLDDDGKPVKRPDGSKIKLTHGVIRGGAVRFPGNPDGPIVICEGPETALSVWWATGIESWVALGQIAGVSLEAVPTARTVIACPDDDPRGHPTIQAANKAVRTWRREGRKVLVATPFDSLQRGKGDHNDALLQHGQDYVVERFRKVLEGHKVDHRTASPVEEGRRELAAAITKAMTKLATEAVAIAKTGAGVEEATQIGIRVTTGGGKSREAVAAMVDAVDRLRDEIPGDAPAIVYAVPTHRLGAELEQRIITEATVQSVDVTVRTWRGREAVNPDTDTPMCGDLDAVKAAQRAMLDVQETVCEADEGRCPHFDTCAYQAQRQASADVWLVPHAVLFHARPANIGDPAILIVDEDIWQTSLRGLEAQRVAVGLASLKRHPHIAKKGTTGDPTRDNDAVNDLITARQQLLTALGNPDVNLRAPLPLSALTDAGLTEDICGKASSLEWRRLKPGNLRPGMNTRQFLQNAKDLADEQGDVSSLATMWKLMGQAIAMGGEACGRLSYEVVGDRSGAQHEAVTLRWAAEIRSGWLAPTLHLSATLRPDLVAHLFPRLTLDADIHLAAPHQTTVALVGKSFSHAAIMEKDSALMLWNLILFRARLTPGHTLAVVPKETEKIIRAAGGIPANVHLLHHNATSGLDGYGRVDLIIVVGRTLPPPAAVSAMAAAITGTPTEPIGAPGGWYRVEMVTVHAGDGTSVTLPKERHLAGLPEEIRAAVCDDQLLQVIGRGRGVNRTAANPLTLELWSDSVPPVNVDAFIQHAYPSKDEIALARGVVTESAADLAKVWPELGTEEAVKMDRKRTGSIPNRYIYWETTPSSESGLPAHLGRGHYQRKAAGAKTKGVIWDRRAVMDVCAFITGKLGPLAKFEESQSPAVQAMAGKTILFCREGTDDTPLRLANGRPLVIGPWELEGHIQPTGTRKTGDRVVFRRDDGMVDIFVETA